jgi:hypothetical protein
MLTYPKEIIEAASGWIEGDVNAKEFLIANNKEELVQMRDAVSRWPKPFEYLLIHKHVILAAFVNAIWEDKKAFKLLMDKKEFIWAAMANIINGDDGAVAFLHKNKLKHYADLAFKIQAKIQKEGNEGTSIFSGPFKIDK